MVSPSEEYDIIVAGAGPAGSVAARQLAIAGARVLLVDRAQFPRAKVCGGCVNAPAAEALATIGLGNIFAKTQAVPLHAFQWHHAKRRVDLNLPGGFAISRATFDQSLVEAAQSAGVTFRDRCSVVGTQIAEDGRAVTLRSAGKTSGVHASIVIDASGLGASLANKISTIKTKVAPRSHMGLSAIAPACPVSNAPGSAPGIEPGVIYMASGPQGYVGAVRLEGDRMDIAAAVSPNFVASHERPAQAVRALFDAAGFSPNCDMNRLAWHGTPLMTRTCTPPAAERLFLIGDAAGYVEPFTGEGIAWAIASACAVVPHVQRALENWSDDAVHAWSACHAELFRARQNRCRRLTRLLRGQLLPAGLTRLLSLLPSLAMPVVRSMSRAYALPTNTENAAPAAIGKEGVVL